MTKTLTTDRLKQITDAISAEPHDYESIYDSIKHGEIAAMARELLANREAQPVAIGEVRLGEPDNVGSYPNVRVVCLHDQADWDNFTNGTKLYLSPPAPVDIKRIERHALRNSMRYQYLRDKDAFGAENEPGLAGWDELIELDGNEFDAAIDARMTHSDIAHTAPPAPVVNPEFTGATAVPEAIITAPVEAMRCGPAASYVMGWNACRAAMLAQPVRRGCTVVPLGWIDCAFRVPDTDGNYWGWWSESKRQGPVWFIKSDVQAQFQSSEITHWMPLPAAPEGGNEK